MSLEFFILLISSLGFSVYFSGINHFKYKNTTVDQIILSLDFLRLFVFVKYQEYIHSDISRRTFVIILIVSNLVLMSFLSKFNK